MKNLFKLSIFLVVFQFSNCCSIPHHLDGNVTDKKRNTVKNAEVYIYENNKTKTDSLGRFQVVFYSITNVEKSWILKVKKEHDSIEIPFEFKDFDEDKKLKKENDCFVVHLQC